MNLKRPVDWARKKVRENLALRRTLHGKKSLSCWLYAYSAIFSLYFGHNFCWSFNFFSLFSSVGLRIGFPCQMCNSLIRYLMHPPLGDKVIGIKSIKSMMMEMTAFWIAGTNFEGRKNLNDIFQSILYEKITVRELRVGILLTFNGLVIWWATELKCCDF